MTFCSLACSGEPDSAKAPPSMITSFCMSWTIRTVRFGSSVKSAISPPTSRLRVHERLAAAGDTGLEAVERRRGRDEHPLPVGAAPVDVPDTLRDLDDAEVLAVRGEDPDALRAGHPDVAALIALHPVDEAALGEVA